MIRNDELYLVVRIVPIYKLISIIAILISNLILQIKLRIYQKYIHHDYYK